MIRDVLDSYNRHLPSILLVSILLVFPISLFIQLVIIYVYKTGEFTYPSLIHLCLMFLNFTLLFAPFRLVAIKDLHDEEYKIKELFLSFFNHFAFILFFTIIVYTLAVFGFFLLLIPTILGFAFILLTPLFLDEQSIKKGFGQVWSVIVKENVSIFVDIIIIISIQSLLWGVFMYIVKGFDNSLLFYLILRAFLNTFLFPLFYLYLTRKYGAILKNEELSVDYDAI